MLRYNYFLNNITYTHTHVREGDSPDYILGKFFIFRVCPISGGFLMENLIFFASNNF